MKKDKRKRIASAEKILKTELRLNLIAKFKEVTSEWHNGSKKLDKQIEKESKKLAKILLKKIDTFKKGDVHPTVNQKENNEPMVAKSKSNGDLPVVPVQKKGTNKKKVNPVKKALAD